MRNETELQRLRRFRDSVFSTLNKYIRYLAKTNSEREILQDVRDELHDPELFKDDPKRSSRR